MEDFMNENILKLFLESESSNKIFKDERKKNQSFQTRDRAKKNKIKFNSYLNEEKSKSDEELESDLLDAIKSYLKNEPKNKKPVEKPDTKTKNPDFSKYISKGAIPKNFTNKSNDKCKKTLKTNKSTLNFNSSPQNQNPPIPLMSIDLNFLKNNLNTKNFNSVQENQNDKIEAVKKVVKQINIKNPTQPFLYSVPNNPSPFFTLPSGNYFVTTDASDLPPINCIISHPKITEAELDFLTKKNNNNKILDENKCVRFDFNNLLNNLGQSENINSSNFNILKNIEENEKENKDEENIQENFEHLKKLKEIQGIFLVEEKFDKTGMPLEDLKYFLKEKINALNATLENLNLLKLTEKIDPDLFSKNTFYNKQFLKLTNNCKKDEIFEDQFFTLTQLFPYSDPQVMKQELAECNGKNDSFLKLVEKKLNEANREKELDPDFKLLLSHFPNHDLDILYDKWSECLGNKDKLLKFIDEEKKIIDIEQSILTEFPEWSVVDARKRAENFVNDESALKTFLAEQRLTKKIEEQFSRIFAILPDHDPVELMAKCQEFKGEEDLINKYVISIQNNMKKEALFLTTQSILPFAEPDFLVQKIEEAQGDEKAINVLIYSLLESNDYPKVKIDNEKIQRQKLWKTYVDEFDVKDFLLEIGNIENLDFNDNDRYLVLNFFQTRYPSNFIDSDDINNLFDDLKSCNMLEECEIFDEEYEYVELCFSDFKNCKFTKSFLEKVVYIDKRKEIKLYLKNLNELKKTEIFFARENNAFLQCPLCMEEEVVESDATTCSDGHVFCKNCVKLYVSVKASDGVYKFQCLSENCNALFTSKVLLEILPKSIFQKLSFKEGAEEINKANIKGLEFCTACDFGYIPLPEEKIFYCQNPSCLKEICRLCKEDSHIPLRCKEVERPKDLEARKKIEEAMSEKLIRFCPNCNRKFIKQDGCNKMTCVCGTKMCYICSKIIVDYDHFKESNGCTLYSNNDTLHHRDVIDAGISARNKILNEDPDIRLFNDPLKKSRSN